MCHALRRRLSSPRVVLSASRRLACMASTTAKWHVCVPGVQKVARTALKVMLNSSMHAWALPLQRLGRVDTTSPTSKSAARNGTNATTASATGWWLERALPIEHRVCFSNAALNRLLRANEDTVDAGVVVVLYWKTCG
mmetsp:Transcript_125701/g.367248  ORF Transcript_125701/g.367248 Transcript_125701/m.367248 type:complete len:138 (-) Transcript_125701:29-442(-)